jgi:hypothetical protein
MINRPASRTELAGQPEESFVRTYRCAPVETPHISDQHITEGHIDRPQVEVAFRN